MTLIELLLIGLAVAGLVGMGIVLGATIMWRLVHRTEPPPLPLWVSITGACSVLLLALPLAAAGRWLAALIVVGGLSIGFVEQAYARMRGQRLPGDLGGIDAGEIGIGSVRGRSGRDQST